MLIEPQGTFDLGELTSASASLVKAARVGAFTDNMKLAVHRWFRYSAGFSAEWVEAVIQNRQRADGLFFDPFAGSGTSLLAAQRVGMASAGAENHPFIGRIAAAKLGWRTDVEEFDQRAGSLLARAEGFRRRNDVTSPLLLKCYTESALDDLESLRCAFLDEPPSDPISDLLWLAITAILRECSGAGTAQWQYVLPKKSKAKIVQPYDAFRKRIRMFCDDMHMRQSADDTHMYDPILRLDDARALGEFTDLAGQVTMVVTSPPYPNNYDYADATRLEMTFWRAIASWSDLHGAVRHRLIRSCSQHSAADKLKLDDLLGHPAVTPIRDELAQVCHSLAEIRETKGGKKTYHTMVAAYFGDLALTWRALRGLCADDAEVCFVIGDSAPYGVHVPAERWLAKLALAEGFSSPAFEKIRDRNVKWKNRKHRVPLLEGNLRVRG